jgi:hypothetical protein
LWSCAEHTLLDREGLVEDKAARLHGTPDRGEEIPLQITCDHDKVEFPDGQRIHREIRTPAENAEAVPRRGRDTVADGIRFHVDAVGLKSVPRKHERVPPATCCEIERAARRRESRGQPRDPLADKRRR